MESLAELFILLKSSLFSFPSKFFLFLINDKFYVNFIELFKSSLLNFFVWLFIFLYIIKLSRLLFWLNNFDFNLSWVDIWDFSS